MSRTSEAFFREELSQLYTVRGVFADPDELRRRLRHSRHADRAAGVGSGIAYSSLQFVVRVTAGRLATVESRVRAAIAGPVR